MTVSAVVRASIAPMHAESRVSSPQVSQRLAGHAVEVLERAGDWLRVRGEDGYEGWMHRGYVVEREGEAPREHGTRRLSLGCLVRDTGTGASRALPLRAWLATADDVVTGSTIDAEDRADAFPRSAAAIAGTAV